MVNRESIVACLLGLAGLVLMFTAAVRLDRLEMRATIPKAPPVRLVQGVLQRFGVFDSNRQCLANFNLSWNASSQPRLSAHGYIFAAWPRNKPIPLSVQARFARSGPLQAFSAAFESGTIENPVTSQVILNADRQAKILTVRSIKGTKARARSFHLPATLLKVSRNDERNWTLSSPLLEQTFTRIPSTIARLLQGTAVEIRLSQPGECPAEPEERRLNSAQAPAGTAALAPSELNHLI